jgi:hypothetical protein
MGVLAMTTKRWLQTRCRLSHFVGLASFSAVLALSAPAAAQSPFDREYEIKAAFLYNFIKFVEWPSQPLRATSDTMTICVLGEDPFEVVNALKDKTVKGRRLVVRQLSAVEPGTCHVAFIALSEARRLPQIMQSIQGTGVLTVGEMDDFLRQGGIINFVIERNKVRFEINLASATRSGLKLSSQLLSLAKAVRE